MTELARTSFARLRLGFAALALTGAALLVACGGDDDDEGDSNENSDSTAESSVTLGPGAQTATPTTEGATAPAETPTEELPTATPDPNFPPPGTPASEVELSEKLQSAAVRALANWLGPAGDPEAITLAAVEGRTWAGGCFELDRPGQACTRDLVQGYRIELALADQVYELRSNASGNQFLWSPPETMSATFVEATTNAITFTTEDGEELVAQPIPGSNIRVDLAALESGAPVTLGLAPHPQAEGWLLVWMDPPAE